MRDALAWRLYGEGGVSTEQVLPGSRTKATGVMEKLRPMQVSMAARKRLSPLRTEQDAHASSQNAEASPVF